MSFVMDHRLADSSFPLAEWDLCHIRLKNDKSWHWLYLVPAREGIREIYDLTAADQVLLVSEIARAAKAINDLFAPDKINTAALGNMVPQLHVHIFGRYNNDPAWPRPVWAVDVPEIPYSDAEAEAKVKQFADYFAALKKT
ncbi:MAG TPA: HIT family protein [Alphaproteobacteria bacterium]|jgi:diadenosine tetraphosphate (Ap4A) HIT family hydrolase|nr:HIT family protein [Alphaproteobacteria bacterium]